MTRREKLQIDLAEAKLARNRLEVALVRAEAALFNAVTDASRTDANRDEAAANVEQARARCRELRAALIKLDASISKASSRGGNKTPVGQLGNGAKTNSPAGRPSTQPGGRAVRVEAQIPQAERVQKVLPHRIEAGFLQLARKASSVNASPSLLRQTFDLSALALAYLAYFHIDVQLQIAKLPSNFPVSHRTAPPARSGAGGEDILFTPDRRSPRELLTLARPNSGALADRRKQDSQHADAPWARRS